MTSFKFTANTVTNRIGKGVSLPLGQNASGPSPLGNFSPTALHDNSFTQYAFPTGWVGRICVIPSSILKAARSRTVIRVSLTSMSAMWTALQFLQPVLLRIQ